MYYIKGDNMSVSNPIYATNSIGKMIGLTEGQTYDISTENGYKCQARNNDILLGVLLNTQLLPKIAIADGDEVCIKLYKEYANQFSVAVNAYNLSVATNRLNIMDVTGQILYVKNEKYKEGRYAYLPNQIIIDNKPYTCGTDPDQNYRGCCYYSSLKDVVCRACSDKYGSNTKEGTFISFCSQCKAGLSWYETCNHGDKFNKDYNQYQDKINAESQELSTVLSGYAAATPGSFNPVSNINCISCKSSNFIESNKSNFSNVYQTNYLNCVINTSPGSSTTLAAAVDNPPVIPPSNPEKIQDLTQPTLSISIAGVRITELGTLSAFIISFIFFVICAFLRF